MDYKPNSKKKSKTKQIIYCAIIHTPKKNGNPSIFGNNRNK